MPQTAYEAFDSAGFRKYLTVKEGKNFLKAAAQLPARERLLCLTLYYVGCRVSEAISLKPNDIDAGEGVVRIFTLKKRDKPHIRRVPIPKQLSRELVRHGAGEERLWAISRMTAWRIIKKVMAAAKITGPQACPKGLRHGFGVRAVLAKVPIHVIQRWMGHSCASTTAIYLAVMGGEERNLMARTWL